MADRHVAHSASSEVSRRILVRDKVAVCKSTLEWSTKVQGEGQVYTVSLIPLEERSIMDLFHKWKCNCKAFEFSRISVST